MKNYFLLIVLFLHGCSRKTLLNSSTFTQASNLCKVNKITSVNNYFIIYAERNDSIFKIVSKKEYIPNCEQIQKNNTYDLNLVSILKNRKINGVELAYSIHITCYAFDNNTNICIEPKKGIYDLYTVVNLRGLCIVK